MHRLEIAAAEPHSWHTSINRHFEMNLAPFSSEFSTFRTSFEDLKDSGFVCRLHGSRRVGENLTVSVRHNDGETAIAFAFARARRELQRHSRFGRR